LIDQGGLEQLDRSKIQRTSLDDVDPVTDYYFGSIVYATVIGYRTDEFAARAPESWADVWNTTDFPGSRSMTDIANGVVDLEFALLADGVPMDQLYPIDVDRAFGKLEEIRDDVIKWWDSGANGAQLLVDKQSVIGSVFNGRLQPFIEEDAPVALNWNGGERFNQGFGIIKGAPNIEAAYQLIDYSMQPEVTAKFCEKIFYGPANQKAFEFIDEATAAKLPTSPDNMEKTFAFDPIWWKDNFDAIAERWQEFLLG
jgi:putative spermidine/putrescine transport system substrate-binding protein